jgi:hypothetical protein
MGNLDKCSVAKVRETCFTRRGSEVSPKEIFEDFYSSLDDLIEFNVSEDLKSRRQSNFEEIVDKERKSLYADCLSNFSDLASGYSAFFVLDNNERVNFRVKPRTNFERGLKKRPNIIQLDSKDYSKLILREAREVDESVLVAKIARSRFGEKFKGNLVSGDMDDEKLNIGNKDVVLVPENQLLLALEQIYAEGIMGRVTPKINIMDADEKNIWYIRNFLPSAADTFFDLPKFMMYSGRLNGLGLMDVIDNQSVHYCNSSDGNVIHIDPDFFAYTPNANIVDQADFGVFSSYVEKASGFIDRLDKDNKKIRSGKIREVRERLNGATLLDYLPRNIFNSPQLGILGTDQVRDKYKGPNLLAGA